MTSSLMFNFSSKESTLIANYFPPIVLDPNSEYVMGLVNLQTYNSVPNIDLSNNKFYYGRELKEAEHNYIEIPVGSYEVADLAKCIAWEVDQRTALMKELNAIFGEPDKDVKKTKTKSTDKLTAKTSKAEPIKPVIKAPEEGPINFRMSVNQNTMKCELKADVYVNFIPEDSLRDLLGFNPAILHPNYLHTSARSVDISRASSLFVRCNITTGSYTGNKQDHTIYQFSLNVPPGYKILEHPTNVIYLPINCRTINNITLTICDPSGKLIDFRGENITICLHLKKVN